MMGPTARWWPTWCRGRRRTPPGPLARPGRWPSGRPSTTRPTPAACRRRAAGTSRSTATGESGGALTLNVKGWDSTYTGQPIPAEEMREWVEGTVERLLALEHRRVLEVGCDSGLLLFRVAPHAERYRGVDFSPVALARGRAGLDRLALPQVELARGTADDWSGIRP